jgi:hypothetical protein
MRAKTKARIKNILILLGVALAVAAMIYAGASTIRRHVNSDVFTDGTQTVTLFDDGRFTADLMFNMSRSGTYELIESVLVETTTIWFHVGDEIYVGWLRGENGEFLRLPVNWEIDENITYLPKR